MKTVLFASLALAAAISLAPAQEKKSDKTLEKAGEKTKAAGRAVVDTTKKAADAVKDAVADRADSARNSVASAGDRLADSLRNAAERVHDGGVPERVLSAVADGVGDAADRLRGQNVADLWTDLRGFAGRHPGAFAAAAAVAGFALARYLRSSSAEARQIERRS